MDAQTFLIAYPPEKRRGDAPYLWCSWVITPIAAILAAMAVRAGITANAITVSSHAIAAAGLAGLVAGHPGFTLVGLVLLNIWFLLDCVDGMVARLGRATSKLGAFLDTAGAHVLYATLPFCLALGLARRPDGSLEAVLGLAGIAHWTPGPVGFLAAGCAGSIAPTLHTVLSRCAVELTGLDTPDGEISSGYGRRVRTLRWVKKNLLEFSGFLLPLLLLGALVSQLDLLLFTLSTLMLLYLSVAIGRWVSRCRVLERTAGVVGAAEETNGEDVR